MGCFRKVEPDLPLSAIEAGDVFAGIVKYKVLCSALGIDFSGKMQTTKPGPYSSICAITSFRASALFFSSATSSLFIRI